MGEGLLRNLFGVACEVVAPVDIRVDADLDMRERLFCNVMRLVVRAGNSVASAVFPGGCVRRDRGAHDWKIAC